MGVAHVEHAGGERAVEAGKPQIEQGKISGPDVVARYAAAIA
ncbi:hypothetical protein ACFOOK_03850 [Micromonospora krabiensis]